MPFLIEDFACKESAEKKNFIHDNVLVINEKCLARKTIYYQTKYQFQNLTNIFIQQGVLQKSGKCILRENTPVLIGPPQWPWI